MSTATLGDRVRLRPASVGPGCSAGFVVDWPGYRPLLADIVPVFERLGVRVADAHSQAGGTTRLDLLLPEGVAPEQALAALDEALAAAWARETELDGLSRLTVTEGLPVSHVTVLRAACRYLALAGTGLSRSYIAETVLGAPRFARALMRRFTARHDPDARDADVAASSAAELD